MLEKNYYLTFTQAAKCKSCTRASIYKAISAAKILEAKLDGKRFVVNDAKFQSWKPSNIGHVKTLQIQERVSLLEKNTQELNKQILDLQAKIAKLDMPKRKTKTTKKK